MPLTSIIFLLCRERDCGFKHLQLLAGAPPSAFWAANYAADMAAFSIPAAGIVTLIAVAGNRLPSLQVTLLAAVCYSFCWPSRPVQLLLRSHV